MVVRNNMPALNANRLLQIAEYKTSKSTEKLSSGKKINRASDDAAGLAISEKMRAQIRGLDMGAKNSLDAISFTQVADEVMSTINDILIRMRELGVQAASDTNEALDRNAIQEEINQLNDEINDICNTTAFNNIYVFKYGNVDDGANALLGLQKILKDDIAHVDKLKDTITFGGPGWSGTGGPTYSIPGQGSGKTEADLAAWLNSTYGVTNSGYPNFAGSGYVNSASNNQVVYVSGTTTLTVDYDYKNLAGDPVISGISISDSSTGTTTSVSSNVVANSGANGSKYGSAWMDYSGLGSSYQIADLIGEGFCSSCATCNRYYNIEFVDSGTLSGGSVKTGTTSGGDTFNYLYTASSTSPRLQIDISAITSGASLVDALMKAVGDSQYFNNHYTQYAVNSAEPAKLYLYDNRTTYATTGGSSTFEPYIRDLQGNADPEVEQSLWIQTGADSNEGIWLAKPMLNATILGTSGLVVTANDSANDAIGRVSKAINTVSQKRAKMGAYSNRLSFKIANNEIASENLTTAESRIRDADMAKEMTEFTRNQILLQSGIAMQAQANNLPQNVLQLIGG